MLSLQAVEAIREAIRQVFRDDIAGLYSEGCVNVIVDKDEPYEITLDYEASRVDFFPEANHFVACCIQTGRDWWYDENDYCDECKPKYKEFNQGNTNGFEPCEECCFQKYAEFEEETEEYIDDVIKTVQRRFELHTI